MFFLCCRTRNRSGCERGTFEIVAACMRLESPAFVNRAGEQSQTAVIWENIWESVEKKQL